MRNYIEEWIIIIIMSAITKIKTLHMMDGWSHILFISHLTLVYEYAHIILFLHPLMNFRYKLFILLMSIYLFKLATKLYDNKIKNLCISNIRWINLNWSKS